MSAISPKSYCGANGEDENGRQREECFCFGAKSARAQVVVRLQLPWRAASPMTRGESILATGYVQSELAVADDPPFIDARPPWAWSVAIASAVLSVTIVVFLVFGRVDSTVRVRGMVLPASGITAVSSERGGIARRILIRPGQRVNPGNPLVIVESADMVAGRASARESLSFAREQARNTAASEDTALKREIEALEHRRVLLSEESASLERTRHLAAVQVETNEQMEQSGLISRTQANRDRAELEQAVRLIIANSEALATLAGEINAARTRHARQMSERSREISRSMADIRIADFRAGEEIVKAASAGVVDTIVVREGETVRAGQMLMRLTPAANDLRIICYVPERDRQRISTGTRSVITLDQFNDDRRFRGRIVRISDLLAVRDEVDATVGNAFPVEYVGYRVEIVLDPEDRRLVRPGMLGDVRIRIGAVRPISLLLGNARASSERTDDER